MMRAYVIIFLIWVGSLQAKSLAPSLAIFTPVEHNIDLLESDILHKALHMAISQSGYFSVLSLDETENILSTLKEESTTKCLSNLCFYMTGRKLGIDLALGSYISKKDNEYYLEVTLYDINALQEVATHTLSIGAESKRNLIDLCKRSTTALVGFSTQPSDTISEKNQTTEKNTFTSWGVSFATLLATVGYFAYDTGIYDNTDNNATMLSSPVQPYGTSSLSGLRGFYATPPAGARYKAMGNTGVSTVNDGFAPLINPAGLVHLTHSAVAISHATLPGDQSQLYVSYSSMLIRNLFQSQAIIVEGDELAREFQFLSSYATDLSLYSKYLTAVRAGITFKGYLLTVGGTGTGIDKSTGYGSGYGIDIGLQWSLLNNFHFGAQLRDLFNNINYSNTLTDQDYQEDLPPTLTIGGYFESSYNLNLATSIQKSLYADQKDHLAVGIEKQIFGILWARGGMSQILNQPEFRKWGLGFGLQHKQGRFTLKIDYSYDYGYENSDFFNKKQNVNFAILF